MEQEIGLIISSVGASALTISGFIWLYLRKRKKLKKTTETFRTKQAEFKKAKPSQAKKVDLKERLTTGLGKTRDQIWAKVFSSLKDNQNFDEIEEVLYTADLSPRLVEEIIASLKSKNSVDEQEAKSQIYQLLESKVKDLAFQENQYEQKPKVVMIVGVNGAGKTTTVGKLATKLTRQGKKVMVGACDTFRAAAVDQLEVWCQRASAEMVRAKENADPSGVAYSTVERAKNEGFDYCLIDTAGRLHTNSNLMDELAKTKRVMSKVIPDAPHEIWLVLDAITGQNALRQAQEFHKSLGLTGLIFTKCDGSSKAGSAIGIMDELKVPIAYIGVGEEVEDLQSFQLTPYLNALLGM